MNTPAKNEAERLRENAELRARLEAAGEIPRAIRAGEVDAPRMSGQAHALPGAETSYRLLAESIQEGAATLAEDGTLLYCNRRLAELLHTPLESLMGSSLRRFVAPADQPAFDALLARGRQGSAKGEIRFQARDGPAAPVQLAVNALETQGARAVGVVATDLTGRKQAETASRESEARYRALFNRSPDGIVIAEIETRKFRQVNPALCRMLGYTGAELCALGVADIHPPEALPRVVAEFEALIRGDKTLAADLPCLRKDGSVVHVDIKAAKVLIDSRPCAVGFFRDITEHKRVEEALRQRAEELTQFNAAAVGRELRMIELKQQVNELARQLGQPPPYDLAGLTEAVPDSTPAAGHGRTEPKAPR
jgi:PAS domain S-box-containing protein